MSLVKGFRVGMIPEPYTVAMAEWLAISEYMFMSAISVLKTPAGVESLLRV